MKSMTLLLVLLSGCLDVPPWQGAVVDPMGDSRWGEQVRIAADAWTCIDVAPGGFPVLLVDDPDWPSDIVGRVDSDGIRIRSGLDAWELPILVHEMGHYLGLGHSTESDSVMVAAVGLNWHPSTADLEVCQ